ncbi:MAG TPA: hypothetical protein VGH89_08170 [Pseudonocardia sp.]
MRVSQAGLLGALRTYSIWDGHDDVIELAVLDHGDGPGAGGRGPVGRGIRCRS